MDGKSVNTNIIDCTKTMKESFNEKDVSDFKAEIVDSPCYFEFVNPNDRTKPTPKETIFELLVNKDFYDAFLFDCVNVLRNNEDTATDREKIFETITEDKYEDEAFEICRRYSVFS